MGRTGMVTIRDVARESGYSASTVSIVLNGAPLSRYIPGETKTRIETAAKRLGYRPNPLARSLRSQRSNIVGVMVFDITDPFCTPILRGLENALYQANYLSLLADAHNEAHRFERYLEMLLDRRVEGLVVIANWLVTDIKLLSDLTECHVPAVIAGRSFENDSVSTVSVDNEGGASMFARKQSVGGGAAALTGCGIRRKIMAKITSSVGDGGENKVHDVCIIQAMLKVIKNSKGQAYLGANYEGSFGPLTKNAITVRQWRRVPAAAFRVTVDGRCTGHPSPNQ